MMGLVLVAVLLLGDIVYLIDGTTVEGEVTRRGGRVIVRMRGGVVVSYPEEEVVKIVSSSSAVGDYRKKAASLSDWDAGGWLALGEWCLSRGMKKEARGCFEKACSSATEDLPKAARRLAALLEEAGDLRRASQLYKMLETSFSDREAAQRRAGVEKKLLERFRKTLWSAQGALAEGNAQKAIGLVAGSRGTWPPQAEEEAVAVLSQARRAEEDALGKLRAPSCGKCSGTGWLTCPECRGKKTVQVTRKFFTFDGMKTRRVTAACGRCKAGGEIRCVTCGGSGCDMSAYDASHKRAAQEFFRVCCANAARPLGAGLPALHKRLVELAPRLPPGLEPSYTGSKSLRDSAGTVPFKRAPAGVASAWRRTPLKEKEEFLRSYAIETAELLRAFPPGPLIPGSDEELARICEPADEALLFAVEDDPRWVSLTTELGEAEGSFENDLLKGRVLPSGLALYGWKEHGRLTFETVIGILGSETAARRSASCDYGLPAKIDELEGQRVRVRGLFHRCPLSPPCARVEVWQIDVRPDEETERMLATGRKKVTFRFERTPLKDAVALLSAVTGTSMRAELPPEAELEVSLSARNEFLAVAVDRMARAARLPWGFDARGIVVGGAGDAERTRKILQLLGGE